MENVKRLIGSRYKKEFKYILQELENCGYKNYWRILNTKDFRSPQNRERVFIVSIRDDIEVNYKFPKSDSDKCKLVDILEENVDIKYYSNIQIDNIEGVHTGIYRQKTGFIVKGIGCTLDASYHKGLGCNQNRIAVVENGWLRRLTPLECWRLMRFEDNDFYKAKKELNSVYYNNKDRSDTQLYKMVGNSIVVDVLEEIFKELFSNKND